MIFCVQDCAPVFGSGKHSPELSCLIIAYLKERKRHIYSVPCRTVYYVYDKRFCVKGRAPVFGRKTVFMELECLIPYLRERKEERDVKHTL